VHVPFGGLRAFQRTNERHRKSPSSCDDWQFRATPVATGPPPADLLETIKTKDSLGAYRRWHRGWVPPSNLDSHGRRERNPKGPIPAGIFFQSRRGDVPKVGPDGWAPERNAPKSLPGSEPSKRIVVHHECAWAKAQA